MKYLHLHDLLFIVLTIAWLFIEIVSVGIMTIIYVVWNFKLPRHIWADFHHNSEDVLTIDYNDISDADKNPWETFKRRINWWNSLKE